MRRHWPAGRLTDHVDPVVPAAGRVSRGIGHDTWDLRRCEEVAAPKTIWISTSYYQTWVFPDDNPSNPSSTARPALRASCGRGLRRVELVGFFFKRWSYAAQDTASGRGRAGQGARVDAGLEKTGRQPSQFRFRCWLPPPRRLQRWWSWPPGGGPADPARQDQLPDSRPIQPARSRRADRSRSPPAANGRTGTGGRSLRHGDFQGVCSRKTSCFQAAEVALAVAVAASGCGLLPGRSLLDQPAGVVSAWWN